MEWVKRWKTGWLENELKVFYEDGEGDISLVLRVMGPNGSISLTGVDIDGISRLEDIADFLRGVAKEIVGGEEDEGIPEKLLGA